MPKPSSPSTRQRPARVSWLHRLAGFLRPLTGKSSTPTKPQSHANSDPLSKAATALLPPFPGLSPDRIHVPHTAAECEAAASAIFAAGIAGFDTEARPTFRAGEKSTGPHVVQFALTDHAYIFQLHRAVCQSTVAHLIESDRLLKVGFGLKNDHSQIRERLGVKLNHVLDLDQIFKKRGHPNQIGVRRAMADLLQLSFPKSKSITTSNWAAQELTPNQLRYAANDAYAALKIMEALNLDLTNLPKEPAPRERKPQAHRRRRHTTKRTPPQA